MCGHPNIVKLLGARHNTDKTVTMVLEKLTPSYAGENAANLYSESFCRKSSPSIETAEVFAGLCTGISAAVKHIRSLAVSHSDIKLRNTGFVLHDNGSLTFKLIDFGSARKLLLDSADASDFRELVFNVLTWGVLSQKMTTR